MSKEIALIAAPFNIGIGGYYREYKVIPRLARLLYSAGYTPVLLIPSNAIRTLANYMLRRTNVRDGIGIVEEKIKIIMDELIKESRGALYIEERLLNKAVESVTKELNRVRKTEVGNLVFDTMILSLKPIIIYKLEQRFLDRCNIGYRKYEYVYSAHETLDFIAPITKIISSSSKVALLLQLDLRGFSGVYTLKILKNIIGSVERFSLLSVSPAPILETPNLWGIVKLFSLAVYVLTPSNAIDEMVLEHRNKAMRKQKYSYVAVYFGRLSQEKGIFDLFKAWKLIKRELRDAKLIIAGAFEDRRVETKFYKALKEAEDVVYLGYVPEREKLYEIISKTSLLIYPSYRDSFSLTVLEALSLGLNVVAYDIPALRYLYGRSPKVALVPKGDYRKLADTAIEMLREPVEGYDPITNRIIEMSSSWNSVALEEFRKLSKALNL